MSLVVNYRNFPLISETQPHEGFPELPESLWITEGSVGQNKGIAVGEEKNNKISSDFSASLSVHETPVHLGEGYNFGQVGIARYRKGLSG